MASKPKRLKFGNIVKERSGKLRARYRNPENKTQWVNAPYTFQTRSQAQEWLTKIEASILTGQWEHPDTVAAREAQQAAQALADQYTVNQWVEQWLTSIDREVEAGTKSVGTARSYNSNIKHLTKTLGDQPLKSLTEDQLTQWYFGLTSGKRSAYIAASTCLRAAVAANKLDKVRLHVPGATKAPKRSSHGQIDPLPTDEQIMRLVNAAIPQVGAAIILAAYSGLRGGEIAALQRKDLKLTGDNPTVTVSKTVARKKDGGNVVKTPKSEAGYRTVSVPLQAAKWLREYMTTNVKANPQALFVYTPEHPDSYLYGGRLTAGKQRFKDALKTAGWESSFVFHDLRRTYLTRLGQNGATLAELMRAAGHTTPETVMVYQVAEAERLRALTNMNDLDLAATENVVPLQRKVT